MNITIPLRLSQVVCFLCGFLLAWCLFGPGAARADDKPAEEVPQAEMVRRTYMMVHDMHILTMNPGVPVEQLVKRFLIPVQVVYPERKPYNKAL